MAIVPVFGAGALTLGLICPAIVAAGHIPLVLSRVSTSAEVQRLCAIASSRVVRLCNLNNETTEEYRIAGLLDIDTENGRREAVAFLRDPDTSLAVTAARQGFSQAEPLLKVAGDQRQDSPLLLVCADNAPTTTWQEFARRDDPGLLSTESIADRICIRFPRTAPDAAAMVEGYAAWVIKHDSLGIARSAFDSVSWVTVEVDLQPARIRKLICINGLQLSYALLAWRDGSILLHDWVAANTSEVEATTAAVANAFAKLSGQPHADIDAICQMTAKRCGSTPDRTGRILGLGLGQTSGHRVDLTFRLEQRLAPLMRYDDTGWIAHLFQVADTVVMGWS